MCICFRGVVQFSEIIIYKFVWRRFKMDSLFGQFSTISLSCGLWLVKNFKTKFVANIKTINNRDDFNDYFYYKLNFRM